MRVGIVDFDTKQERTGHGLTVRFPNIACGQMYGYHVQRGDTVVFPWRGERVERLYVSVLYTWSRPAVERLVPLWEQAADEVLIGGTGWDWRVPLPAAIATTSPRWTYELYGIDYGIGYTQRGCHVGCPYCVVPRKEGRREYRVGQIADLVNPRSQHLVLLNNNSMAEEGFFEDVAEIRERGLTVNWNQANDITLLTPRHAAALAGVRYRNFNATNPMLHFAMDQMQRRKRDPATGEIVTYDMLALVPERVQMLKAAGIPAYHLTFYLLLGYDTTMEEDLVRFHLLHDLGCNVYALIYRPLSGPASRDGKGRPQGYWVKPLRDWINGHAFRTTPFVEFDRLQRAMQQMRLDTAE